MRSDLVTRLEGAGGKRLDVAGPHAASFDSVEAALRAFAQVGGAITADLIGAISTEQDATARSLEGEMKALFAARAARGVGPSVVVS